MALDEKLWVSRRVLVTGHTGFKGAWLSLLLSRLGGRIYGYALDPPSGASLFQDAAAAEVFESDVRGDVLDLAGLASAVRRARPEVVFHLAAHPLVRESYTDPLRTYAVNVMGTANLLECLRGVDEVKAIVVVTTDKCYDNKEWVWPYRESDALGGHDPYSSSKAGTELVAAAYRSSFFSGGPRLATARAGNVIGGGDWGSDRLVPDCIRAFARGEAVELRYPHAVRPWQHVLDPLSGYTALAQQLIGENGAAAEGAWNFGPDPTGEATVADVANGVARHWGEGAQVRTDQSAPALHEASVLRLDSTKARTRLNWRPQFDFESGLAETVDWYRAWHSKQNMVAFTRAQLERFAGKRQ